MFVLSTNMLLVVATVLVLSVNGNTIRAKPGRKAIDTTGVFSANELLCDAPLGLSTGFIGDSQLSASSSYDSNHDIRNIRLTTTQRPYAAWCAGHNNVHQHVQVDFGKITRVTGVATQGRGDKYQQWVTAYKIMYSNDKRVWKYYKENNDDKVFSANAEQFSVVRNNFAQAVSTRYIRINPISWHTHISMRAEFFGCHKACESPLGMTTGAIATSGLESSSNYDDQHHQKFSRLNSINLGPNSLSWCAAQNDHNQFLQIDIGYVTTVTAVSTQGRSKDNNNCCDQWVTSYRVQYSKDGYLWNYYEVNGNIKTFSGNSDNDGVVRNYFSDGAVSARYIRIRPRAVHGHTSMRAEVYGCPKKCDLPLGMTTGAIANHQVHSSSDYDHAHSTKFARLTTTNLVGASAWCSKILDTNQWLQINLGKVRRVTAVATQGRSGSDQWVTTYYVEHSTNGDDWNTYEDNRGNAKLFIGNSDQESVVKNALGQEGIAAQYIRFQPRSWYGHISMRVELFGCSD